MRGECTFIFENVEMIFPDEGFFSEPLPAVVAGEREEERRTITLAELREEFEARAATEAAEDEADAREDAELEALEEEEAMPPP